MGTTEYCVEPRWQNFWMVSSILILGPAAFFAGYGLGGGQFQLSNSLANNVVVDDGSSKDGSIVGPADFAPENSNQPYFLQSGEYLSYSSGASADQSNARRCMQGYRQNNPSKLILLCLGLQSNGNLILFEQQASDVVGQDFESKILWSSQVSLRGGSYWTRLQGDGNLVTRRGEPEQDGGAVWDSKSNSVIHTDYQLTVTRDGLGMQIIRPSESTVTVGGVLSIPQQVLWSSISTFFAPITPPDLPVAPPPTGTAPVTVPVTTPVAAPVITPVVQPTQAPLEELPVATVESPLAAPIGTLPPQDTPRPTTALQELLPPESQGWSTVPWSTESALRSGPMVGHTTADSVQIWALQGQGKALELVYRPRTSSRPDASSDQVSVNMPPNADQGSAILEISGLEPNTRYDFQVRINGERVGEGSWKTAPIHRQPVQFQFLLASCMDIKRSQFKKQMVWDRVWQEGPDFAMLNGDTVYLNDQDWSSDGSQTIRLDRVWARNLEQRGESHFKRFIANVPMYATWDDHEYGANNSDKNQSGKYNSLRAFTNLWAHPSAGTTSAEGVFYTYYWGDVQFIVCDNRWYRDRTTGTQWGEAQKQWIYEQLKESQAPFKIIVSGGDVMERGFSADVDDLGKVVSQFKISGVLFCAGDIHRNEFKTMSNGFWPYKITQITSSAIAREWRRPWAMVRVDTTKSDPEIVASFFGADTTAQETTWGNDPNLSCSLIQGTDRYLEHRCTEVIKLSDLTA